ncbi:MAG: ribosomal subunit interface protein [Planctomycetaceae bacterium]|nr:ribosomal subunit interface protein [Planctomycetaceae bacterium]
MHVEISTDTRTTVDAPAVTATVESGLSRYRSRLARVEVHLRDVNGPKGGVESRCVLEARPSGRQPEAVTNDALTSDEAVKGAIEKMNRLLVSLFGRLDDVRGGPSASGLPT